MSTDNKNMDNLYEEFFGTRPKKSGAGYELIVASVLKCLNRDAKITHNVFLENSYSGGKFQLDSLIECDNNIFVEAKDYSWSRDKVGRGDISKLSGSLLVLEEIDEGIMASATDFTKPAKEYSKDLIQAKAKPIDLYIVRACTEVDRRNRVETIVVTLKIILPVYEQASYVPHLTDEAKQILADILKKNNNIKNDTLRLDNLYRKDGSLLESINNLTKKLKVNYNTMKAIGRWAFNEPAYFKVEENLVPIEHIEYNIPHQTIKQELRYEGGVPVVLVKSIDGKIDKLISIDDLIKAHDEIQK